MAITVGKRGRVQQDEQQNAPDAAGEPDAGALVSEAATAPGAPTSAATSTTTAPDQRQRDGLGRFLPRNLERFRTGLHTDRLPPRLAIINQEVERFDAGQLSDEGEAEDQIHTRRRSQLRYRTFVHRQILGVAAALEHEGIKDKHGKMRLLWLGKLETLIGIAVRIDQLLGLERRSKLVHETPGEWLERIAKSKQKKEEQDNDTAPISSQQIGSTAQHSDDDSDDE